MPWRRCRRLISVDDDAFTVRRYKYRCFLRIPYVYFHFITRFPINVRFGDINNGYTITKTTWAKSLVIQNYKAQNEINHGAKACTSRMCALRQRLKFLRCWVPTLLYSLKPPRRGSALVLHQPYAGRTTHFLNGCCESGHGAALQDSTGAALELSCLLYTRKPFHVVFRFSFISKKFALAVIPANTVS